MAMQEHQDPAADAAHGASPAGAETHAAAEHESSGGLPQFDFAQWPGQIAWFLVIFFVVLAFVRFFVTPKLGGTIEARDSKIEGDIAEARIGKARDAAMTNVHQIGSETAQAIVEKLTGKPATSAELAAVRS